MIKEEFYFDSRDGESRIHAVRYTPDDGNVKGIVQVVHGMAEYVERYVRLNQFFGILRRCNHVIGLLVHVGQIFSKKWGQKVRTDE